MNTRHVAAGRESAGAGSGTCRTGGAAMSARRLFLVRVIALAVVAFGLTYIAWRWSNTIAWAAWWIAVPLALAETYSLSESILYSLTMWNSKRRPAPPPARPGRTVDVFITTYNEPPLELVMKTALAAREMTYRTRPGSSMTGTGRSSAGPPPQPGGWGGTSFAARSGKGVRGSPRPGT